MSTRSNIIAPHSDGQYRRIYVHFDGYLSGVGATLLAHYTDQTKPFDAPSRFSDAEAYAEYKSKFGNMCLAYGRDRGERDTEAQKAATVAELWPAPDSWVEFVYVWDGKSWRYSGGDIDSLKRLTRKAVAE